jgi:hypothetical protein
MMVKTKFLMFIFNDLRKSHFFHARKIGSLILYDEEFYRRSKSYR